MLCFLLAAALSIIEINFESPIIPFGDLFDMTGNQFEIKNLDDFKGIYTVVYTINQSSKTYKYQLNLDSEPYFRAAGLDMDEDYENDFPRGSVSFDVKFIKNGVVEGIGNFTAFIALPIEVHKAVMEPKIIEFSPTTVLPIVINLTNYNPDHNSQIYLQSPRRRIGWPNNKSINYYFEHQKESTQGTTKLYSNMPSGHNYTLNLYVIDGSVQKSKTNFKIDYAVRKRMNITFVEHDKEFYYPNDESNLTFVFTIPEENDTWYTVYVNEKKSVLITNNKPFHISYQIPSTAELGDFQITYSVTVEDILKSENYSLTLKIRDKPVLTNIVNKETYLISETINILFDCIDHDSTDSFQIQYLMEDDAGYKNYGERVPREGDTTKMSFLVDKDKLKRGRNIFNLSVVDNYSIESDPISLLIMIVGPPTIIVSNNESFFIPGSKISPHIIITDLDEDENESISYYFDNDENSKKHLQSILIDSSTHVYNGDLQQIEIPSTARSGTINLTIVVTDRYNFTTNATLVLTIREPPVLTGENISEIKTPSSNATFTIKVEDHDENDYCDLFYHYDGLNEPVNVSRTSINQSTHQASVPVEITLPEEYSGVFSITFYAIDSHNITSQNITLTVEIRNKPEIQIEKGIPQIVQRNEKYTISVKVTDNDAEEEFSFFINGENYTKKFYSNSKETDADLDIQIPNNLLGETNIILKAVDKYGLQSEPVQLNFSIRSKPEIKINEGQRKRFIPGSTIDLSVFIKDDDPGDNSTFIVKFPDKEFHFNDAFQTNESGANHTLSITIPSNVKGGNESIIVTAKDYFNLSSSDTTSIYIPTAPVIQYEGTDSNTTIPGNFARPKFLVSDKDGDKNITIIINLPDGTNISKQADCSRINEPELKCNNNPYEIDIKIPEDHPITKPYIINVTVIDSDGQGQNITAEIPFKNIAPQIEYTNKNELEKDNEYYQTRNITIKFRVKDSNFGDWANIYMKIQPDEKELFNQVIIINKTKTGQNWTDFEFNLTIPSDYKDDDYNITLWATDKFGAESNSTYVMIKIRGSYAALAGNVDLRILVERRWIILVVVACIIAVILFIIFIIILLIRPEPKIKQVVKEPSEEIDRDDSGETISVHSDDMDDENPPPFGPHNLVPIDINEDDNEDSGESFSIHTDEIITDEIDLS